jgi:superfamily I DNA and/or RNA helicase
LALENAANYDVGIITPYRAQSRLFHAMATDAQKAMTNLHPIKCATAHEFQGSEKDMIFYDAVECYFSRFPGRLISDTKNNYANRLFNVALTRAKGKFIGITNVNYM